MKSAKYPDAFKALVVFLVIAVSLLSYYVSGIKSDIDALKKIPAIQQSIKFGTVLANLGELNETKGYTKVVSLEEISPENLQQLQGQQPVIYDGLPGKALYRLVLSRENQSVLVIYDLEGNKILRYFDLSQMQLGQ